MTGVPVLRALMLTVGLLSAVGCGGGGGSSDGAGGGGSLNVQPVWEQPSGGGGVSQLPSAVTTVRIVFTSDAGLHCCLAVDPHSVPIDSASGLRLLVLDALPAGTGTLTLSGYATDFAPAPPGITDVCPTSPAKVGQACDANRLATPSFESDPQTVSIVAGTRAKSPSIDVHALPFLINLNPGQGDTVHSPVPISFTAVDATTAINPNSITLEASFRSLTKRVPIKLTACSDSATPPCSAQGKLQVSGYNAEAAPFPFPAGPVSLRIVAQDLAAPPAQVDFSYAFTATEPSAVSSQSVASPSPVDQPSPTISAGQGTTLPLTESPQSSGDTVCTDSCPTATPVPLLLCPTPTPTATPTVEPPVDELP